MADFHSGDLRAWVTFDGTMREVMAEWVRGWGQGIVPSVIIFGLWMFAFALVIIGWVG